MHCLHRHHRALDEVGDEGFELRAGELEREVLRAGSVGGDEGQVDLGFDRARERDLGLLRLFLETLKSHLVLGEVDPGVLLELRDDPLHDLLVDVVAAEVGVAVGGLDLDDALPHFEDGDVEGAAAEVVDRDGLVLLLVEAVGEGRGRGLVDDAENLEAGDLARVLGGLALGVVEVGGNRDDRLVDGGAEVIFGGLLELLQDHGRDLGRRVDLAADLDPREAVLLDDLVGHELGLVADFGIAAAHEALHGVDRGFGVRHGLALGDLTDETLAVFGERDDGRRGATAF
jgi:hypothetical protein